MGNNRPLGIAMTKNIVGVNGIDPVRQCTNQRSIGELNVDRSQSRSQPIDKQLTFFPMNPIPEVYQPHF